MNVGALATNLKLFGIENPEWATATYSVEFAHAEPTNVVAYPKLVGNP